MTAHARRRPVTACLLTLVVVATGSLVQGARPAQATDRNAINHGPLAAMSLVEHGSFARGVADRAFVERSGAAITPVRLDTVLDEGPATTRPQCHESDVHVATSYEAACWSETDDVTAGWYPQGITGSGDASGRSQLWSACRGCPQREVLAVSWHRNNTAARVSFVDVTGGRTSARYSHVLLVVPDRTRGRFHRFATHADGIAWYGNMLYLMSGRGSRVVRVFDLRHIWRMSGTAARVGCDEATRACSAGGAAFALPQAGYYTYAGGGRCDSLVGNRPCFTSVSLDRSTAPDSLVTSEYNVAHRGRIVRWPLDYPSGRLLPSRDKKVHARAGWYAPVRRVQGVTISGNRAVLAALCQDGAPPVSYMGGDGTPFYDNQAKACLYSAILSGDRQRLSVRSWTTVPANIQNVAYWPSSGTLWTVNEFRGSGKFPSDRLLIAFNCRGLSCN